MSHACLAGHAWLTGMFRTLGWMEDRAEAVHSAGRPGVTQTRFLISSLASRPLLSLPATGIAIPAVLAANVIWGLSFVATKPLLAHLPPATLACGRLIVALLVLIPVLLITGRSIPLGKAPAMLGAVGVAATVLLQNLSLERTSATSAACLSSVVPALAVVFAFVMLKHQPSRGELVAVAVSIGGVSCILSTDLGANAGLSPLGDLLALASAASIALYLVLGRRYFGQFDPVALVAGSTLFALAMLLPLMVWEVSRTEVTMPAPAAGLPALIYLGAGASAMAFCLEGRALRQLAPGQVATFGNLAPVIGVGAAALMLGEALAPLQVVGGVLAIGGAYLVTVDRR